MKLPLTRPRKAQGVLQPDLTPLTQSPRQERGHWSGKVRKFLTPVKVSLVILALGSFIAYHAFGGHVVQEISRIFRQVTRIASTSQDRLVIPEPKVSPEGELVSNRPTLPKPEAKQEAPPVPPDEGKSPAGQIPAEVAPSPEPKSLAISPQPFLITIKKGESLYRIIARHYKQNQQIGLVAIMLANPEISKDYVIYAGQVLKLPQLDPKGNIIRLQDNLYYGLYGRYYSDNDLKDHTLWLQKKNIKFSVMNTQDVSKKNVHLVILGGYEKKEDLKIALQSVKTNSE
jgi:LysM repeat protein